MAWALLTPEHQTTLADRVRQGDASGEEELARLFHDRILAMMLARTREPEAARDLTQETMLAVIRALRDGQVREPGKLAAFVHGTARNVVNNYLRRRAREPHAVPLAPELAAIDPDETLEASERVNLVRRALARLDRTDRTILLLTLVHGLRPAEIAARVGLGAEAVRTRKSRALKKTIDRVQRLSRP